MVVDVGRADVWAVRDRSVLLPTLLERLAAVGVADVGYRAAGALVVHADPARLDQVETLVRRRTADVAVAGSVERLDERHARAVFPPLATNLQAVYVSGGARVDGRQLRVGLLTGAQRLGAVIVDATARLGPTAAGTWEVHTSSGQIGADVVVLACGAWVNSVLEPLGYALAVEPQRGQLVHLLLDGRDTESWPSVLPLSASHYLVPFDAGRIVVGATRETGSGFDPRVTAGGVLEVIRNALSVAPGLAAASVIETRVGLRPLSARQLPFLGPVQGLDNLFVNSGFGAAGLTMAPVVGEALAQLILTGSSGIDLSAFAPPPRR